MATPKTKKEGRFVKKKKSRDFEVKKDGRFLKKNKNKNKKKKIREFEVLVGDQKAAAATAVAAAAAAAAARCSLDGRKRKTIAKPQTRPWSDLPADLIGDLVAALSPLDQIRFGGACRSYRLSNLIPNHDQVLDKQRLVLPWLVQYEVDSDTVYRGLKCEVFHPIGRKPAYEVYTIMNKLDRFSSTRTQVLACKHDWMFFSWPDVKKQYKIMDDKYVIDAVTCFVLFSPFTHQIVTTLPDLHRGAILAEFYPFRGRELGTFSSHPPSSPDCVYFVFRHCGHHQKIVISTYHQGDSDWNTQIFGHDPTQFPRFESVVYFEGSFYVVSNDGNLAEYSVLDRDWKYVIDSKPLLLCWKASRLTHLMVHCGQLLLACVDQPHDGNNNKEQCSVFVFSKSTTSWIKQTTLGDYALFLGCTSFSVPTPAAATTTTTMRDDDVAGKIFYYKSTGTDEKKKKGLCYSLKDGDFCPSVYNNNSGIWIQPPHCMPTTTSDAFATSLKDGSSLLCPPPTMESSVALYN